MTRTTRFALCTTSFLALFASSAMAQESDSASVGEIIVTAEKREASVNSVPMSITAMTGEALEEQGITQVRDLERVATGFSYVEGSFSMPVYSLRGVGFNDSTLGSRPTVSVYVDETPLPFAIMTRGAALDVQRVEVLKGPQGTLFGQNATGGAINYVAARPGDEVETGLDLELGNYGAVNVGGFVSGPMAESWGGRLAFRMESRNGWQESASRPGDTLGDVDFMQGRLLLDWDPASPFSATLTLSAYIDRSETQAGQFYQYQLFNASGEGLGLNPFLAAVTRPPESNEYADWLQGRDYGRDNEFAQAALRWDWEFSPSLTLTSLTSFVTYDHYHSQAYDGTQYNAGSFVTRGEIDAFNQELRLSGEGWNRLQWILGVNYEEASVFQMDDGHTDSSASFALAPFAAYFTDYGQYSNQEFETLAIFGNVDFDLTSTLTAHLGARYTEARDDFNGCSIDGTYLGDPSLSIGLAGVYSYIRSLIPPEAGGPLPPVTIEPNGCVTMTSPLQTRPTLKLGWTEILEGNHAPEALHARGDRIEASPS
ncbi:MAG: TonB-dependent receptor [Hyphomonadaceae bacterium]